MKPPNRRQQVSHERWLVSYADFITLLFAFFVVLYAFAKADAKRQLQVAQAVDTAFHSLGMNGDVTRQNGEPGGPSNSSDQAALAGEAVIAQQPRTASRIQDDLESIRRRLQQTLAPQIAQHTVSIEMGRDGLVISLREAGFFASGSADPRPGTAGALRQIAASLQDEPYAVRIEGHTDNVPIHNAEFDSNWELSSARATRIARIFLELHAAPPDRVSAAGYAEYHPVASNETAEGRAENRRVDLVIAPRSEIDFAHLSATPSAGPWTRITDE